MDQIVVYQYILGLQPYYLYTTISQQYKPIPQHSIRITVAIQSILVHTTYHQSPH